MPSFVNQDVRLLKHDSRIVREDHLDTPWEETTGETVDEVIFLSKHTAASNRPALTVHSIGSTEEYWKRQDAAQAIALLVWEGLGLGGRDAVGVWSRNSSQQKILLGIGGGHYVPRHMDIVRKEGVWVGHLLAGYSLPMEDRGPSKAQANLEVCGTWRQAIRVAFDTTTAAFPQGEVLEHVDSKSFKGWQRNAIMGFLADRT
ncbi:hypothetical protein K7X08_031626 [Anisodus acutangulus]|uniref:D-aminoacyl-tRNA deacylase n=1 Tax=Anisodus acutangulus TaxID=402998 RepID=A0A9Q1MQF8_9SOLA|nr:hypothetical protein K7X08_031626 [Anisodus acutangulus]